MNHELVDTHPPTVHRFRPQTQNAGWQAFLWCPSPLPPPPHPQKRELKNTKKTKQTQTKPKQNPNTPNKKHPVPPPKEKNKKEKNKKTKQGTPGLLLLISPVLPLPGSSLRGLHLWMRGPVHGPPLLEAHRGGLRSASASTPVEPTRGPTDPQRPFCAFWRLFFVKQESIHLFLGLLFFLVGGEGGVVADELQAMAWAFIRRLLYINGGEGILLIPRKELGV